MKKRGLTVLIVSQDGRIEHYYGVRKVYSDIFLTLVHHDGSQSIIAGVSYFEVSA